MRNRWFVFVLSLSLAATFGACDGAGKPETSGSGVQVAAGSCAKHGIPDVICPFCHPEFIEQRGPCVEHGVPEALCYLCNPAIIPAFKVELDWCKEHERPESQCWICHPDKDPTKKQAAADLPPSDVRLEAAQGLDTPRSRRAPTVSCTKQDLLVRFARAEIAQEVGLQYENVAERRITKTIECGATIDYDHDHYARLSSQTAGVVDEMRATLGDAVGAGDVLAVVSSAEVGASKAAFLAARAEFEVAERNRAREDDLVARGVSTERDGLEASARLAEARAGSAQALDDLGRLGLSTAQIDEIARTGDTSPRLALKAPFAGVVVERNATRGEAAIPGATLVAVADVSRLWALIDVWEDDVQLVRRGQPVAVSVDALPGETFGGRLSWVATGVDPVTRALAARAVLDNADGRLKAELFGRATIFVRDADLAVVVPVAAVQWEGCCNVVFVRRDDTLFEPRKVRLGTSTGTVYEVLEGVTAGEVVVTDGSFLLKTEIMKGSIGAGCCEVEPRA